MDNLIGIVGDELCAWEQDPSHDKRYSILTQNMMLAAKVRKHQHLTPRSSRLAEEDEKSFHSAESSLSPPRSADSPRRPGNVPAAHAAASQTNTTPANVGRPRTKGRNANRQISASSSSGDWTWRPSIPPRTSSRSTKFKKGKGRSRPDLATFHRRSCQLFSSFDSTLSNASSTQSDGSRTSTSTSPSLASSVTTQATWLLDDRLPTAPAFSSFHLDLHDPPALAQRCPSSSFDFGDLVANHMPILASPRSSSQLSPHITSTEQVFWTTDATRQAEYAKIDAAHGGLKGLVKRMLPRGWAWAQGKRRNFYEHNTTSPGQVDTIEDDKDSVHRFRIGSVSAAQEPVKAAEAHSASHADTSPPLGYDSQVGGSRLDLETGYVSKPSAKASPVNKVLAKVRSSRGLAKMFRSTKQ